MAEAEADAEDCQKTDLTACLLVLNVFYSFTVVYQWFISKKTIIFQVSEESDIFRGGGGVQNFPGGGGPTFSRGGGSKCLPV